MKYVLWIGLFFLVAYLIPLGSRPMIIPDECRYAEVPREMMLSGDYVTPRLLGLRYFEKPAGGYWLTAASFHFFGLNRFALRLPSALAAGLTAIFIAMLLQQVLREAKLSALAAILYLCCGLVYGVGTFAVLDSQLSCSLAACCGAMYFAMAEKEFTRRKVLFLVLAGVAAGCAFLIKGFVGLCVPFLAVSGFLVWERRWKDFLILPWIPLAAMLLTVGPWVWAVHKAEPDYWRYFIEVQHIQRFTKAGYDQHEEGWWFFLPVLVGCAFPALLLLPAACAAGKEACKKLLQNPLYRFSLCYLVLPLIFFSCSSGKLATYILPCYVPLAILLAAGTAEYFRSGHSCRTFHITLNLWGALLLLVGIAATGTGIALPERWMKSIPYARIGFETVGALCIVYGSVLLFARKSPWRIRLILFFCGIALLLAAGPWFVGGHFKMPVEPLQKFPAALGFNPGEVRLVTVTTFMQAVSWTYRSCNVESINPGELDYGHQEALKHGERGLLVTSEELSSYLQQPKHRGVVMIQRYKPTRDPILLGSKNQERKDCISDGILCSYYPPRSCVK